MGRPPVDAPCYTGCMDWLAAGTSVGGYVVEEPIAAGGFGAVYRARRGPRAVALKVLHAELAGDPEAVARFEREARAAARIRHPNVAELIDLGFDPGAGAWIAMELLAGDSVRDRLRAHGRMAPERARDVVAPLCDALDAAHAAGIVHRDVKASNVFLAGTRVVLLDFGVAKLVDDAGPGITSSRHVVGTPPCMAPEQIAGGTVDARTDVYALGVLSYQLLTAALPFSHPDAGVVCQMHLDAEPPPPSRRAPVGPAFDELIRGAMAKDPAMRPASAGAFAAAFDRALAELRGERPPPFASDGPALAVYVTLEIEPDEDHELAVARAALALSELGLRTVFHSVDAALLVGELTDDVQARAIESAHALCAAAEAPLGICIRTGPAADVSEPPEPRGPGVHVL